MCGPQISFQIQTMFDNLTDVLTAQVAKIKKDSTKTDLQTQIVGGIKIQPGKFLCEAAIWVHWKTRGELVALGYSQLLIVDETLFHQVIKAYDCIRG